LPVYKSQPQEKVKLEMEVEVESEGRIIDLKQPNESMNDALMVARINHVFKKDGAMYCEVLISQRGVVFR
jgi:hypothetical protein